MKFNCPGFLSDFDPGAMFLRILVPVDFGPESRRALGLACVFRQNFGSEIHVFHLTAFGINDDYIRGLGQPWSEADIREESKEQLRMFGESICRGLPCTYHEAIVGDDVVQGIAEAADRCKATLVILPVVHPGRRLLLNRSEKIARAVNAPVLFLKDVPVTSTVPEATPSRACDLD
jgi:nucleotide-binding universal stress UspA family protein